MDESVVLVDAIAGVWPGEPALEVAGIAPRLLAALRELDEADRVEADAAQQRVLDVLREVPALEAEVRERVAELLLLSQRGRSPAVGGPVVRHSVVPLLYATNRRRTSEQSSDRWYDGARGAEMRYGVAQVALPDDPRMRHFERPRPWWPSFGRPNHPGTRLSEQASFQHAINHLDKPGRDFLVFIHGFNVDFSGAVRRAAQLAYDLNFSGTTVLYSWPSEGDAGSYVVDGSNAEASFRYFREFLAEMSVASRGGQIHILAHSMGNRILVDALSRQRMPLGQVIFAAPDVDAGFFVDQFMGSDGVARRCTLYASTNDRALRLAQRLARHPRAGQAGPDIIVVAGLDTIDASELDTDFIGHSYAMDHRSVVADVHSLIAHNDPPDDRFGMRPAESSRGRYWVFRR